MIRTRAQLIIKVFWFPYYVLMGMVCLTPLALVISKLDSWSPLSSSIAFILTYFFGVLFWIFLTSGLVEYLQKGHVQGSHSLVWVENAWTIPRYAIRGPRWRSRQISTDLCQGCFDIVCRSKLLWGSSWPFVPAKETYPFPCFALSREAPAPTCTSCRLCRLLLTTLRSQDDNSSNNDLASAAIDVSRNGGYGTFASTDVTRNDSSLPSLNIFEVDGEEGRTYVQMVMPGYMSPALVVLDGYRSRRKNPQIKDISDCTGSDDVAQLARQWLNTCTENHLQCQRRTTFRPNRLLQILDVTTVKLVETTLEPDTEYEYIALSHRWGDRGVHFRHTTENHETLAVPFASSSMPKNFQDAIRFTEALGYSYIWIDSICIIQDSPSDTRAEVMAMSKIFSAAVCTIAATASAHPEGGCFRMREPAQYSNSELVSSDRNYVYVSPRLREQSLNIDELFVDKVETAPLNQRAWTFQERLLSRRVIHFSERTVLFECSGMYASEWHPKGTPYQRNRYIRFDGRLYTGEELAVFQANHPEYILQESMGPPQLVLGSSRMRPMKRSSWIRNPQYRATEMERKRILEHSARSGLRGGLEMLQTLPKDLSQAEKLECHRRWYELVSAYSHRSMTFRSDRLRALVGLTNLIKTNTGMVNVAGLWETTLAFDLLWTPTVCEKQPSGPSVAPSWSWASVNGQVESLLSSFTAAHEGVEAKVERKVHIETSIQFSEALQPGDDLAYEAFGQTDVNKKAYLLLYGPVRIVRLGDLRMKPDHADVPLGVKVTCLLVYSEPARKDASTLRWAGLLLQATDRDGPDFVYKRVGSVVAESPREWVQNGWDSKFLTMI